MVSVTQERRISATPDAVWYVISTPEMHERLDARCHLESTTGGGDVGSEYVLVVRAGLARARLRYVRLFDHAKGPTAVDWEIVAQPPENAGQVSVGLQVAVHRPRPERLIATFVDEDNEVPAVAHSDQVPFVNAVNLHVRQSRPRPGGNFLAHRLRTSPHADSRRCDALAKRPDRGYLLHCPLDRVEAQSRSAG